MKRILVTGSTGFIGRSLINHSSHVDDIEYVEVSRAKGFDLSRQGWTNNLPDEQVDVVVHLAQSPYYRDFPQHANDIFQVNTASTLELADWARQHEVNRFLYASTGNVYQSKVHPAPFVEGDLTAATSMYAASKICSEVFLAPFSDFFDVVVMRIFGIYGPGQSKMLIANMHERIIKNREITLSKGVGMYLTPLYVNDCVEIIRRLYDRELSQAYSLLNLAGEKCLSLSEIVEVISHQLGISPNIIETDGEPGYLCGEVMRLQEFFTEFTSFEEGVKAMLS